jgi:hypothetical protein
VPPRSSGGGCGQQGGSQGPGYIIILVDYFVRPEGEDLKRYELRGYAPVDVYEQFKPEIEYLLGSVEYTGELSAEFFAPDAPAAKLPGEEAVEENPGADGGKVGFMVAAFVIAIIWMFMRRRKSQSEGSAS